MMKFFKGKKSEPGLSFVDVDGLPMKVGDIVMSGRYNLGECKVIKEEKGFAYQSLETGKTVSWTKMIDASTKNQKVKKLEK